MERRPIIRDVIERTAGRPQLADIGAAILAGGAATRLPGKLALDVEGLPLVARVRRNVAGVGETLLSVATTPEAEIDALLDAPLVVDRGRRRGPLGGLVTTLALMHKRLVFVVAGDVPRAGTALIQTLARAYSPGDEAVVPEHPDDKGTRLEPLCALYDRAALLDVVSAVLREPDASMHGVLARLRTRRVWFSNAAVFVNVNTPADYARLQNASN